MRCQGDTVMLAIKLQPRAAREDIGPAQGAELKIKVTAPPVDAAANEALLRLLAKRLDCPRGAVQLVRGHTSRHKVVAVRGLPPRQIEDKLFLRDTATKQEICRLPAQMKGPAL